MALSLAWNRSKLNLSLAQADNITLASPVENVTQWFIPLTLDDVELDQYTEAACSAASGVAIITKDSGTFGDVRPGDLVTGDANIPAGSFVLSRDSDTQITIDQNTTGVVTAATLTFNATGTKTLTSTFFAIVLTFTVALNQVKLTPEFRIYDGTLSDDVDNDGVDAIDVNTTPTSTVTLASQNTPSVDINLNNFLNALRVAQTDS